MIQTEISNNFLVLINYKTQKNMCTHKYKQLKCYLIGVVDRKLMGF